MNDPIDPKNFPFKLKEYLKNRIFDGAVCIDDIIHYVQYSSTNLRKNPFYTTFSMEDFKNNKFDLVDVYQL